MKKKDGINHQKIMRCGVKNLHSGFLCMVHRRHLTSWAVPGIHVVLYGSVMHPWYRPLFSERDEIKCKIDIYFTSMIDQLQSMGHV